MLLDCTIQNTFFVKFIHDITHRQRWCYDKGAVATTARVVATKRQFDLLTTPIRVQWKLWGRKKKWPFKCTFQYHLFHPIYLAWPMNLGLHQNISNEIYILILHHIIYFRLLQVQFHNNNTQERRVTVLVESDKDRSPSLLVCLSAPSSQSCLVFIAESRLVREVSERSLGTTKQLLS